MFKMNLREIERKWSGGPWCWPPRVALYQL